MSSSRLDSLYPALTAKERAILVLKATKEDRDEDLRVRRSMPRQQAIEFNRLIDLIRGVRHLSLYIAMLEQIVGNLSLRYGWLMTLVLWGDAVLRLEGYILLYTKEPITESEHSRLLAEGRREMAPPSELAEVLVERYDGWSEADLMPPPEGDGPEPWVTNRAWRRMLREKGAEITHLVDAGTLQGRRSGRRMLVNVGSFYDWLGEPVRLFPEWGLHYEVFPDEEADKVRALGAVRRRAQEAARRSPPAPGVRRLRSDPAPVTEDDDAVTFGDDLDVILTTTLRDGIRRHWCEVVAVESVVAEISQEFDGEDPLHPPARSTLDDIRKRLQDLHEKVQEYAELFDLPEPDEDTLTLMRQIVETGAK